MKDPLIKGHRLHALLADLLIGRLAGGTACDLLGFANRRHTWRFAARAMHTGACASGVAAALVGLWDYQAVPREHPAAAPVRSTATSTPRCSLCCSPAYYSVVSHRVPRTGGRARRRSPSPAWR